MVDIDIKAQALSAARNRILQLQEQMTDKVLQMAAEVGKLMEIVPISDAKAFLKARCNLPTTELSTYVGFAKALKGSMGLALMSALKGWETDWEPMFRNPHAGSAHSAVLRISLSSPSLSSDFEFSGDWRSEPVTA
ncbi:hypothetical protein [Rhizobium mongolense]|uniref:Uncharacterized protein n=1 Tax=Rhizobium mongolense TaxID=57676 RepID=A0A7W6WDH6_9HYPH|nr:hypothetical protein [Rhizobium mongolense]MBB4274101.1 hypothetical protein [Rhizobium mongolense]